MAEIITIELSNSEAQEFLEVGQAVNPDATVAELREWAAIVAKNGLRAEVGRIKRDQIRVDQGIQMAQEFEEFEEAWPYVPAATDEDSTLENPPDNGPG